MIIGLEWIVIIGGFITILSMCLGLAFQYKAEVFSAICACVALLSVIVFGVFTVGIGNAQSNVEEHYIDYLKLQTQVAKYDDLDMLEQFKVNDDVMTYNLWYERNKSDLENEWSFKGSSGYAKEFDYIIIGG